MRRRPLAAIVIVMGVIGLAAVTMSPHFQSIHTVDALQLLGSGMCFGVGLTILLRRE
jgi:drug/metabolite transporter (DMT)-like permease